MNHLVVLTFLPNIASFGHPKASNYPRWSSEILQATFWTCSTKITWGFDND